MAQRLQHSLAALAEDWGVGSSTLQFRTPYSCSFRGIFSR